MTDPTPIAGDSPVGFYVDEGAIPLGTTAYTVAKALKNLIQRSDWFREYKEFYFDKQRSMKHPYVMITLEDMKTQGLITGRAFDATFVVSFARADLQKTLTEKAAYDMERFWELLHLNPRLGDLDMVDLAKVVYGRILNADGGQYFETVAEMKVNVKMHRRL